MFSCEFCKVSKNSFSDKKKVFLIVVCLKIFNNDICVIDNALFDIDLTSTNDLLELKNRLCIFIMSHTRLEWIYILQFPEYQGTLCSKQARCLKNKWLQRDLNPQPLNS